MPITLKTPPPELLELIRQRFAYEPHLSLLEANEQQQWIEQLQAALPAIAPSIEIELLSVWSYNRWPHLFQYKGRQVVIDDQLNRQTISSLESYYYLRDRPLVAWLYFALVFGELITAGGYAKRDELCRVLFLIARSDLAKEMNEHSVVRRPALIAKIVMDKLEGEDRTEKLQSEASGIYAAFHEIGHAVFQQERELADTAGHLIRNFIEQLLQEATLEDAAIHYWLNPSVHDPRYGLARVKEENRDALNEKLRREVIEELFCDCFASSLLMLSPAFLDLTGAALLEMVIRYQGWIQLITDARTELKQIATVRKRWRPTVHDATAFRQQLLTPMLRNRTLSSAIFGADDADRLQERIAAVDEQAWSERVTRAINRRQYLRFLNLYHPMREDLELLNGRTQLETILNAIYGQLSAEIASGTSKYVLTHQPAEWGAGDPERLRSDLLRIVQEGRVEDMEIAWDGIEDLTPFVAEGYRLLNQLRRHFWVESTEAEKGNAQADPDLPQNCQETVNALGKFSRYARLGIMQWLSENPGQLFQIVCLDCRGVFPFDGEEVREQLQALPLDTPMSKITDGMHCPRCQSTRVTHTGMLYAAE